MQTVGAVILMLVCVYVLKSIGFRGASVVCAVFFVLIIGAEIKELSSSISPLLNMLSDGVASEAVMCALKVIGVGYIFGVVSDVCRSLSENEMAKSIEVVGRVEMFVLILPFVQNIFSLISGLL